MTDFKVNHSTSSYDGKTGTLKAEGKLLDMGEKDVWFRDSWLQEVAPPPPPPPPPPPSGLAVKLVGVKDGDVLSGSYSEGSANQISADVSGLAAGDAVAKVEFFLDHALNNTEANPPYVLVLNTAGLAPNPRVLKATATTAKGASASAQASVTIGGATPPPPPPPPPPPGGQVVITTRPPRGRPGFRGVGENVEDSQKQRMEVRVVPQRTAKGRVAIEWKWDGFGRCSSYGSGCYAWGSIDQARIDDSYLLCDPATGDPVEASQFGKASRSFAEGKAAWKKLNPGGSEVIGFIPSGAAIDMQAGVPIWYRYDPASNVQSHGASWDMVRTSAEGGGPQRTNTWPGDYLGRQSLLACEVARVGGVYGGEHRGGQAETAMPTLIIVYEDGVIEPVQPLYAYHGSGRSRAWRVPADKTKLVAVGAKSKGGGGKIAWSCAGKSGSVSHDGDYDERDIDGKGTRDEKGLYSGITGVQLAAGASVALSADFDCILEMDDGSLSGFIPGEEIVTGAGLWAVFA